MITRKINGRAMLITHSTTSPVLTQGLLGGGGGRSYAVFSREFRFIVEGILTFSLSGDVLLASVSPGKDFINQVIRSKPVTAVVCRQFVASSFNDVWRVNWERKQWGAERRVPGGKEHTRHGDQRVYTVVGYAGFPP